MTHNAQTFELLGPLDLGPEPIWRHIPACGLEAWREAGGPLPVETLCGHVSKTKRHSSVGRPCPDCERIARARGLL